jgi:adenine deaminase
MSRERLARLIAVARGDEPADLVFRGGRVINVFSRTVLQRDLAVTDGFVVGLGDYQGREIVDVSDQYLLPGLIEGHLHVESTLLTPAGLARAVVGRGTSVLIGDPHEIVNVNGLAGLDYMLDASQGLPVDVFYMLSSCVPATGFETSGADLEAADLIAYADHPRILGLAEMMNFPGVVAGDPGVLDKLVAFWDAHVDGHSPLLSGKRLNAYLLAGPRTDHECLRLDEAWEKLDAGMWIMIRQATLAHNLEALLPLVHPATCRRCLLVSDDLHPDLILEQGHLDRLLRLAVAHGLDPLIAVQMVTLNPAECFGLTRRGALAPGYLADVVVVGDLERFPIKRVYKNGRLKAKDGRAVDFPETEVAYGLTSMNLPEITPEKFRLPAEGDQAKVIEIVPDQLITNRLVLTPRTADGLVVSDPKSDVLKLAVIERYTGRAGTGLGLVKGFGLKDGALASSVAHDSHNIIVVGVSDQDMAAAADAVRRMGGGLAAVARGEVMASLPLPVAGLMSELPVAEVAAGLHAVRAAARELGSPLAAPYMALSFLALPVIPSLKLTDRGLVDVDRFQTVSLFGQN